MNRPNVTESNVTESTVREMVTSVAAIVGDDGTGDLRVIVEYALRADPAASVQDIADIVREAQQEWALEREHMRTLR